MLFQSESYLIKTLYSGSNRKQKDICNDDKLLTTTTTMNKIGDIIKCIKMLSKKFPDEKIHYVEIGVKYGGVIKHVLDNTKDINLDIIGIDLFEDIDIKDDTNTHKGDVANIEDMRRKLKDYGHNNITLYKGDSSNILTTLENMKNVVCFIDGNHTYFSVKADYLGIREKMNCGYIIFDDIDPFWPGVNKFYRELPNNIKVITYNSYGIIKIRL